MGIQKTGASSSVNGIYSGTLESNRIAVRTITGLAPHAD